VLPDIIVHRKPIDFCDDGAGVHRVITGAERFADYIVAVKVGHRQVHPECRLDAPHLVRVKILVTGVLILRGIEHTPDQQIKRKITGYGVNLLSLQGHFRERIIMPQVLFNGNLRRKRFYLRDQGIEISIHLLL